MKISKFIYLILVLSVFLSSCEKMEDFSLSESVFISDPYYPGLPIYSEWGYNTFGAYIDRKPFTSTDDDLPVKIIVNTDTMHITLRGRMNGQSIDLKFSIKGHSPAHYYDLTELDSLTFNLKESGRAVTLKIGNETTNLTIIEGELMIKRAQQLYVDEDSMRAILSGYFNLKTFLDGEPVAISYGRFDLGIGYENFYNY
ncbi:MAG: hypothetical protein K9H49_12115 [Bacteroidales bacterium]|nr:hypothetical protein [Bacteroidales bacterium]MCF8392123.1 hypothetical protein [Bacteroidales bacterium]